MKCIKCGNDSSRRKRTVNSCRCPTCSHTFVTEPFIYNMTDMMVKMTEDIVSSNGTFYFSKEHLKYQLMRTFKKKIKFNFILQIIISSIFLGLTIISVIYNPPLIFLIVLFSAGLFYFPSMAKKKSENALNYIDTVVSKWVQINPHEKLLTDDKYQTSFSKKRSDNLDDVSFDRVLICERDEIVDFFLSNLFHFHYSCPVLGGNNYPPGICEDMLHRLKQNPNLTIFLIHDYSPEGIAFARKIATDPEWFRDQKDQIIDLGLTVGQEKLYKSMMIPHRDSYWKMTDIAELEIFRPATLVGLCGAAINQRMPLDLVRDSTASVHGGGDGYG